MICAVTGGTGFIGAELITTLMGNGHTIRMLSRRTSAPLHGVDLVEGDLARDDCPVEHLVADCDVVFHCAGELRRTELMRPLHVDGTARLLAAARREAARSTKPLRWIQLSSVGAYGPPAGRASEDRVVTEESPVRPIDEYEITKVASDTLVEDAARAGEISCSIVRPSNVFGAAMSNDSLRALARAVKRGRFFYIGRAGAVATYVHVADLVDLLVRCATHAATGVFNLSNDCLLADVIEGIAAAVRVRPPRLRVPEPIARALVAGPGHLVPLPLTSSRIDALVARTRYPFSKAQRELGFVPARSVPDTIREIAGAA